MTHLAFKRSQRSGYLRLYRQHLRLREQTPSTTLDIRFSDSDDAIDLAQAVIRERLTMGDLTDEQAVRELVRIARNHEIAIAEAPLQPPLSDEERATFAQWSFKELLQL